MRVRVAVLLAVISAIAGAGVVACGDLFHSTRDVLSACELDANTPGCSPEASVEAGSDAATDFCRWPEDLAHQNAEHACAWLGACESPLGRNAFGSCMFQALLAYDCVANPNHPVKGKAHDRWDCLWRAQSCGDVHACVFSEGPQACASGGTDFVGCATEGGINADVRAECAADGGRPHGESCALWGQTCGGNDGVGICAGSAGGAAVSCVQSSCASHAIHQCNDAGVDIGIDCSNNGAQDCSGFPSATSVQWLACVPESDGGTCTPDASATCDNGIAVSCPAGVPESVNCLTLLDGTNACVPGKLWPEYDWTAPCFVQGDAGDASTCVDTCSGTHVVACYRGASYAIDCASVQLGACRMVLTDIGTVANAACTPPP